MGLHVIENLYRSHILYTVIQYSIGNLHSILFIFSGQSCHPLLCCYSLWPPSLPRGPGPSGYHWRGWFWGDLPCNSIRQLIRGNHSWGSPSREWGPNSRHQWSILGWQQDLVWCCQWVLKPASGWIWAGKDWPDQSAERVWTWIFGTTPWGPNWWSIRKIFWPISLWKSFSSWQL